MNKTQSCLSREVLDQIGRDELLPNELQCIEDHVSECERCRDLFAAVTVEPDWSDAILPILREPRAAMPAIGDTDQSREPDSALSLLGPTDDPHMLGRIGSYEVTGVIGRGGMGIVFKAFDAPLNRFVAIKMMLPHLATSGAARKRFSREGQAAAAVIDDHVLPIYGVNEWQGVPYLVSQYSSGMSLQKRIHDQAPLELKEILRISLQTARGLAAAHAQGLVHRDVKPSNILLDGTVERALLTDFGLARAVDDASLTRSGTITGTPQYMAPEQARGEAIDQRSDLFSLGAVIYTMCTGHPPFRAETSYGVLRRITDDEPRSIREINPDIPAWLCGIVARLLAKQPADRFASANEVAGLLEKCLAHVQQPATVPLPHSLIAETPATNRNHRPQIVKFIAAAGFAFVMLFAGLLIVQRLNKSADEPVAGAQAGARGKQIATVLGKPIYESDLNKNLGDKDNLIHLLFEPLMEHYCQQEGIGRDAELKAKITDEPTRTAARIFVMRSELNRHLYEKYGGRVQLTAFGPYAFDGQIKWLEDRRKAGDFNIIDPSFQAMFDELWVKEPKGAIFASPSQIKEGFDPAVTARFIDNYSKIPAGAFLNPALKLVGVVAGNPVYLPEQALNDPDLPRILHQLIVWPLEKHYLKKHPEVAPTEAEIDALAAQRGKQDAERAVDYRKGIEEQKKQMENLEADSDALLELQAQQRILENKLTNSGGREAAALFSAQKKFQKHLYDNFGGGRAAQTPQGSVAFDAQRKWVEQRQGLGDFQIADPALNKAFYDYWDASPPRIPSGYLIDDLEQAKAIFGQQTTGDDQASSESRALDDIDRELAGLAAIIHHDFANDGVPNEQFAVRGDDGSDLTAAQSDGLHVTHRGKDGYSNTYVETLNRIHGNFDVTVSFKDFTIEPGENGSGGISLTAILENASHTHGTVHRGATVDYVNPIWNFVQGEFVHSPQRDPGVVWLGTTGEEATSGRLRLARVDETLYCLFAANDSPEFRLIHTEQVGPEDLLFGGIRLIAGVQCNGSTKGTTSVVWKDITIRAEQITDWAGEDQGGQEPSGILDDK